VPDTSIHMCIAALVLCVTGVGGVGRPSELVASLLEYMSASQLLQASTHMSGPTPLLLLVSACVTGVSGVGGPSDGDAERG
jgi:hypothetical protein